MLEILLCLNVISHVVFGLDDSLVSCSGGSSLLGLDKWNSTDLRCCDPSGVCHGYDIQSVAIKVTHSLQNMLNATLPIPRSTQYKGWVPNICYNYYGTITLWRNYSPPKEESRIGARHEAVHVHSSEADEEVDSPVTPCCRSKLSVFYPITGISATSSKYNLTS